MHAQNEKDSRKNKGGRAPVSKACIQCRRRHVACEERRPCKTCVSRGIGHLCKDAKKEAHFVITLDPRSNLVPTVRERNPNKQTSSSLDDLELEHSPSSDDDMVPHATGSSDEETMAAEQHRKRPGSVSYPGPISHLNQQQRAPLRNHFSAPPQVQVKKWHNPVYVPDSPVNSYTKSELTTTATVSSSTRTPTQVRNSNKTNNQVNSSESNELNSSDPDFVVPLATMKSLLESNNQLKSQIAHLYSVVAEMEQKLSDAKLHNNQLENLVQTSRTYPPRPQSPSQPENQSQTFYQFTANSIIENSDFETQSNYNNNNNPNPTTGFYANSSAPFYSDSENGFGPPQQHHSPQHSQLQQQSQLPHFCDISNSVQINHQQSYSVQNHGQHQQQQQNLFQNQDQYQFYQQQRQFQDHQNQHQHHQNQHHNHQHQNQHQHHQNQQNHHHNQNQHQSHQHQQLQQLQHQHQQLQHQQQQKWYENNNNNEATTTLGYTFINPDFM